MLVAARIVTEAGLTENLTEQQTSHPTTIRKTEHHSTNSRRPLHIIKNNRNPIVLKDEKKKIADARYPEKKKENPQRPFNGRVILSFLRVFVVFFHLLSAGRKPLFAGQCFPCCQS